MRLRLDLAGVLVDLNFATGHEALAASIRELWGHLLAASPVSADFVADEILFVSLPDEGGASVRPFGARRISVRPGPGAGYVLSGALTRRTITHLRGARLLLHAGAVERLDEGVILLVGPSGAGKSTATTKLGQCGRYLTDELAILDPSTYCVTGFAKPISAVVQGASAQGKRDIALEDLGLEPARGAGAPDHVVFLDRQREEGSQVSIDSLESVERVPLVEALLRLAEQASSLWAVPGGLGHLAEILSRCDGALRIRYKEAEKLNELLRERPQPLREEWSVLESAVARSGGGGGYEVASYSEAIELAEGVVVLAEGKVASLLGLAGLVWAELCTSGPLDVRELERAVVDAIGPHPRSMELVDEALSKLISEGWVRRRASSNE